MRLLGIDPGLDGCMCVLDIGDITNVYFFDTPTIVLKGAKNRAIDIAQIVVLLTQPIWPKQGKPEFFHVALEKVSAAPMSIPGKPGEKLRTQGTVSMFHFGEGYGIWQGVLAALKIPYTLVHPRTWKTALMRDMGKEKTPSIIRAKQLYPQAAPSLTLKKHHGRADALLLAHYLRLEQRADNQFRESGIEEPPFALQPREEPFT